MVSVSLPLHDALGLRHALMEAMRWTAVSYLYIWQLYVPTHISITICTASCQNGGFWCSSDQCISSSERCNGVSSCSDGSDEMNCSKFLTVANLCTKQLSMYLTTISTASCQSGAFRCSNGQCIPSSSHCDRVQDCTDGNDETECSKLTTWFI